MRGARFEGYLLEFFQNTIVYYNKLQYTIEYYNILSQGLAHPQPPRQAEHLQPAMVCTSSILLHTQGRGAFPEIRDAFTGGCRAFIGAYSGEKRTSRVKG